MTSDKLLLGTTALLSALAEAPPGAGAPSGHLYAALMADFSLTEFLAVQADLLRRGFATLDGQVLVLTPLGREVAAQLEALLKKARRA